MRWTTTGRGRLGRTSGLGTRSGVATAGRARAVESPLSLVLVIVANRRVRSLCKYLCCLVKLTNLSASVSLCWCRSLPPTPGTGCPYRRPSSRCASCQPQGSLAGSPSSPPFPWVTGLSSPPWLPDRRSCSTYGGRRGGPLAQRDGRGSPG